jgi:hypothetical protein
LQLAGGLDGWPLLGVLVSCCMLAATILQHLSESSHFGTLSFFSADQACGLLTSHNIVYLQTLYSVSGFVH